MLVGAELGRLAPAIHLLGRGPRDPIHKRAHVIAGAEARAGLRGLPPNAVPEQTRKRASRAWLELVSDLSSGHSGRLSKTV
jgi:hypothetical protein